MLKEIVLVFALSYCGLTINIDDKVCRIKYDDEITGEKNIVHHWVIKESNKKKDEYVLELIKNPRLEGEGELLIKKDRIIYKYSISQKTGF